MTDETAPVQPAPSPVQQAIDWEGRYRGASTKINELTNQLAALQGQLSALTSENEQLKSGLSLKDVEKDVAANTYRKQLEEALSAKSAADTELARLRAMEAKLKLANELNAPHLVPIMDKIPYVENLDAMREIMKSFLDWGQNLVKGREKELMAGVTPPPPATVVAAEALPTTTQEWDKYVNSFTPGTPEREATMSKWWAWGQAQSQRR